MRKVCLALAILALIAPCGWANILTNGDFESLGWTFYGSSGRDNWSGRAGAYGGTLYSWNDVGTNHSGFWQDVPFAGNGTYTFSIWVHCETNFDPTLFDVKMEWYDATETNKVQDDTIAHWVGVPRDGFWHRIFVNGLSTNAATVYVRPVIDSAWVLAPNPGGYQSVMLDDASLQIGPVTGGEYLVNGSFEGGNVDTDGATYTNGNWRSAAWEEVVENYRSVRGINWAARSGQYGVALYGADSTVFSNNQTMISQPIYPGTGTYSFAVWINRETFFTLTNAELHLEWYDITCSNKVQADSVAVLSVTNDWTWHEYWVTGTCANTNLYEMRPVIFAQYVTSTNNGGAALKFDDARVLPGAYDGWSVQTNWAYHTADDSVLGTLPMIEQVPWTNGFATFQRANYNTGTNTTYVMVDSPTAAKYSGQEGARVGLRYAWPIPPAFTNWGEVYTDMVKVSTTVLPASSFHGQPASGSHTVDIWKLDWPLPTDAVSGLLSTNDLIAYYSPFIETTNFMWADSNNLQNTDFKYLVQLFGAATNSLGQILDGYYGDKDCFYYYHLPQVHSSFTNGNFEIPGANNWSTSGWVAVTPRSQSFPQAGMEVWANRTAGGAYGGYFETWNSGYSYVFQDVASTGGTSVFSMHLQIQPGVVLSNGYLRLEYYDKQGAVLQRFERDVSYIPHENAWHKAFVAGGSTSTNVDHVRVGVWASYGTGTVSSDEGFLFDDAELGTFNTQLQNPGFEVGYGQTLPQWQLFPLTEISIDAWAAHSGSNGASFHGWDSYTNTWTGYVTQPLIASNGTYVFSIWAAREANFNLTNAWMKIEWYDSTFTNKVQADSVINITIPNDNTWRQYAVTGTCSSANLQYAQPYFYVQWTTNALDPRSLKVDDASFTYVGPSVVDGIPASWWQQYFTNSLSWVATNDPDGDGFNNGEEYIAKTDPTNPASFFATADITNQPGKYVMNLDVSPTYTDRVYDAFYRTNLLPESSPWLAVGLNVTGNSGTISLTVTNKDLDGFYRTGAKLH